ncbi:uncharacterized protein LOC129277672 [Lytechinus pictus]|uniref:uncharacterized protein LOC129277672 n=1 Tax=Lytechinus pictus TaxID=7653 RepID=UPI0030B9B5A9
MAQGCIHDTYVGLNVGGKIYQTSCTTLLSHPGSFFHGLLTGNVPSAKDDQGNYFIDQDGEMFRHVLNFLRYRKLAPPEKIGDFHTLEGMADFFLLEELKACLVGMKRAKSVGLNVGGKIYRTSCETLTRVPNSFFQEMLRSGHPVKDDLGNYLIDQDGDIFRHVLNFLRHGKLVLPEGFNEYDLLECQAEFFQLQSLRSSIVRPVPIGGAVGLVFDDGKVFHTTRETLMREETSFFSKMLSGEGTIARDLHGNYIMDRNGTLFHHILSYLRHGRILNPINADELDLLQKDAEYFELKVFADHAKSVQILQKKNSSFLVFYFHINSQACFAYIPSNSYPVGVRACLSHFQNLFYKTVKVVSNVQSAMVNVNDMDWSLSSVGIKDMKAYLESEAPEHAYIFEFQLSLNCFKLTVSV